MHVKEITIKATELPRFPLKGCQCLTDRNGPAVAQIRWEGNENTRNTTGSLIIDKESEVYKMLQEKQELNEPHKQSTCFLVLQKILESEEKGDPSEPSAFRSVKVPVTKVAASVRNAQKLPMCDKCDTGIVGVFVKLRNHHHHPLCYVCTDCGTNLKQQGHFFVEDQIYCEKLAWERVTPPEDYDVVRVLQQLCTDGYSPPNLYGTCCLE
ncbi:PDZ and LIM domain protein 1 [Fukomys damarensis]|uniref:PDZ and LIM domain protein 1 n=1 Tax=Fukomys damarensis TaxID=885580 RepID=A0A091DVM0_FUKDA|nr:PDZ and LIM domain protein 1 [Fukomys damarensis]